MSNIKSQVFYAYDGENWGHPATILYVTPADYWCEEECLDDRGAKKSVSNLLAKYGFTEKSECKFAGTQYTAKQITDILSKDPNFIADEDFAAFIEECK
jgi:hypothetical protein